MSNADDNKSVCGWCGADDSHNVSAGRGDFRCSSCGSWDGFISTKAFNERVEHYAEIKSKQRK